MIRNMWKHEQSKSESSWATGRKGQVQTCMRGEAQSISLAAIIRKVVLTCWDCFLPGCWKFSCAMAELLCFAAKKSATWAGRWWCGSKRPWKLD